MGVIRKPPSMRALTLPDLPRLISSAFICSAVAMIAWRSAAPVRPQPRSQRTAIGSLGKHRRAALGASRAMPRSVSEAADEPRRRHVESEIDRARVRRARASTRGRLAVVVAAQDGQHLVGGARLDRNRARRKRAAQSIVGDGSAT